jgi:zinc protease
MNLRRLLFCSMVLALAAAGTARAFPIRTDTLKNGLVMFTSEDHHLPMLQLEMCIRAGSAADPQGLDGLANFVATLLTRGTQTRSAQTLNKEIEFVGGQMSASADYDHTVVNIKVLAKDLSLALDLLTDMVLHPAFSDSETNRAREEIRGDIKRRLDDPGTVSGDAFNHDLFGTSPYGHPAIGYDSTVARLSRDEIAAFHKTWFVPNNCYFCAVGDFSAESLKAGLERRLAGWAASPVPQVKMRELPPITGLHGRVISRPEMIQAYVALGNYGIRENAPDVFACRLMNFVLGGSVFSSKIGTAVRGERGLAYDARSWFDRRLLGGAFISTVQTRTDSARASINLIIKQLADVREKGISAQDLQRAKDYYLGSFPLQYESFGDKLNAMDRMALFGLGLDYFDTYAARVNAVTQTDVLNAARNHVFPDNFIMVVVGNLTPDKLNMPGMVWQK